jgi:hypothetical protein
MSIRNAWRTAAACLILAALGTTVGAQEPARSFDALPALVKAGDTVTVFDTSGRAIKGTITAISPSSVALRWKDGGTSLAQGDVTRMTRRKRGSIGKGAAWGLGIGTAVGLGVWGGRLVHGSLCECSSGIEGGSVALFAAAGTGMGIAIAARARDQVVFSRSGAASRLTVAPLVSRARQGLLITYGF